MNMIEFNRARHGSLHFWCGCGSPNRSHTKTYTPALALRLHTRRVDVLGLTHKKTRGQSIISSRRKNIFFSLRTYFLKIFQKTENFNFCSEIMKKKSKI